MDDHVGGRPDRAVFVTESEPVAADVPRHRADAARRHLGERLRCVWPTVEFAESVERVVLQELLLDTLGCRRPAAVADEEDQLAVGNAAQQALDESGSDEPGRARDGHALASEGLCDHNGYVYQMVERCSMVTSHG